MPAGRLVKPTITARVYNMTDNKDFRLQWLSQKISDILGIDDKIFANELIEKNIEQIKDFFDSEFQTNEDLNKGIIFLWRTFYDKMVEETIIVMEEGKQEIFFSIYKYVCN